MTATAANEPLATRQRLKSIFGGSAGNLVEWYDWYAYAAFTLYFAPHFFPKGDQTTQLLNTAAVFAVGFDQPNWHNGFEHDPEESARVRIALLKELAGTGEMLVATHLPFPSVGRVSLEGETFRWVPVFWDF